MIRKCARAEDFRADDRQQKAFGGHAVVGKKAAHGKRERSQHAHPTDLCRVAAAPWSAAFVCADRADTVLRLVLQPLRAGEWDLVCAHCPGSDFVGRVVGAESPQCYLIMCSA